MSNHPITPPPELVWEWTSLANEEDGDEVWISITTQAARWGADQELEACCEVLDNLNEGSWSKYIRVARRPKPPTLKEQGLESLDEVIKCLKVLVPDAPVDGIHIENIRRALEALPND
jgi:hypothetical protein